MKYKTVFKTIVILLTAAALVAGFFAWRYYSTFKRPNTIKESVIYISSSMNYDEVTDVLRESGSFRNFNSFIRAARSREFEKHFEPGRYRITEGLSNQQVIRIIANGREDPVRLTLRAHLRRPCDLAAFLGRNFEADSASFAQVINDDNFHIFIPNTYYIYWTESPQDIVARLNSESESFWNGRRDSLARSIGMTRREVITLASIVCEETNITSEMYKIAGVYINRLYKNMALQACPTIKYAFIDSEPDLKRILFRHLEVNSPYNTYKRRGLPPGPITIPPVAAIDAVLEYEKSDYLYFCAKPTFDGTHNFTSSFKQHKQHSAAYNKAFKENFGTKITEK